MRRLSLVRTKLLATEWVFPADGGGITSARTEVISMQYARSFRESVSKTWNSINPATLSGAIDVVVVEQEDGKVWRRQSLRVESLMA